MKLDQYRLFAWINLGLTLMLGYFVFARPAKIPDFSNDVIKTRGIIITDSLGIERVIISSPLPDPIYAGGQRLPRDGDVSGILLLDADGLERSGYVTDNDYGNVLFTLDSKSDQHVLFIAEPQGGATLMMFDKNNNKVVLGAYEEGIDFKLINNGESINYQQNENN